MFEAFSILSALSLLLVAGFVYLWVQQYPQLPYTVALVIAGIALAAIGEFFGTSLFTAFSLTPELLFYVFLPTLIFEAAYNMPLKNFYKSFFSISLLSTIGLCIAAFTVAFVGHWALQLFGIEVPFLILLLFGSIISATDPIGVLSLFKTLGAPSRLSLMFEGESLFNDATAVAMFLSVLAIIQSPQMTMNEGILTAGSMFVSMIVLGALFGLVVGKVFSILIEKSRHSELAALLFMLVMAHISFLSSELLNELLLAKGYAIGISPIIATTVASLQLGNSGGIALLPKVKRFVHHFWVQVSFFVNSLIFLLLGILVVQMNIFSAELTIPILIGVAAVFLSRLVSVYPLLTVINWLKLEDKIPDTWKTFMSWASIRGALSIIMVLTLPEDLTIPYWSFSVSAREFVIALTLGAVLASLLIKTMTSRWFLKKLHILDLDQSEQVMLSETRRFMTELKMKKLTTVHHKGYVSDFAYQELSAQLKKEIESCSLGDTHIFSNIIQHYAIGIEKYHLNLLYQRSELDLPLYLRLYAKVDGQEVSLDNDCENTGASTAFVQRQIDSYEQQVSSSSLDLPVEQRFLYYRALSIMARKVVKDLQQKDFAEVYQEQLTRVISRYKKYHDSNKQKMSELERDHPQRIHHLTIKMGQYMLDDYQEDVLDDLVANHFTTERVRANI